jgi:hypothetical protein
MPLQNFRLKRKYGTGGTDENDRLCRIVFITKEGTSLNW